MNTNMLSNEYKIETNELVNKGFFILDTMFKTNGWHFTKNESNWICYTRLGYETEYFEIKIEQLKICVSIPIKNTRFQYTTSFKDYFSASEYIEEVFNDFIKDCSV